MQTIILKWKDILDIVPDVTFYKFKDELDKWKWIVDPDGPIYHIEVDWLWVWLHQDWDYVIYMRYLDKANEKEYVLYDEEYYDMNDEIFFKRFIDELDELYDIQDTLRSEWKLSYDILEWL